MTMTESEREEWLATRKEEGFKIDPATAKVWWRYAQTLDPYGIEPDLPPECDCIGRAYFAWRPEIGIWVAFEDLPHATREALWRRIGAGEFDLGLDVLAMFGVGGNPSSPPVR